MLLMIYRLGINIGKMVGKKLTTYFVYTCRHRIYCNGGDIVFNRQITTGTPSPNRAYLALCFRHFTQIKLSGWTSTLETHMKWRFLIFMMKDYTRWEYGEEIDSCLAAHCPDPFHFIEVITPTIVLLKKVCSIIIAKRKVDLTI